VRRKGNILILSDKKVAALLTAAVAAISFAGLVWISERPEPEPKISAPDKRRFEPPVLPPVALPPSGLEGLGKLPPAPAPSSQKP
jgi:hypothetical protein